MSPDTKHTVDAVSAAVAAGTVFKFLPAVAALFTIVWTAIRIYEMATGKPFSESFVAKWITGRA